MTGRLYIIATPIGNLYDITLRAVETLKNVDIVLAEDTRVAQKLLSSLNIKKPIERFDDNIKEERIKSLVKKIKGKSAALISDAGTPNISDPGYKLISIALGSGIKIVPIPGPSALITALSASHFPVNNFIFLGFPPHKKGRSKFFKSLIDQQLVIVLYESTHRILKTVRDLAVHLPEREVLIAKELTKIHERVWRGVIGDIAKELDRLDRKELRGEWVIILANFDNR